MSVRSVVSTVESDYSCRTNHEIFSMNHDLLKSTKVLPHKIPQAAI